MNVSVYSCTTESPGKKRRLRDATRCFPAAAGVDVTEKEAVWVVDSRTTSTGTLRSSECKRPRLQRSVRFDADLPNYASSADAATARLANTANRASFKTGCPGVFTTEQRNRCWVQPEDLKRLIADIRGSLERARLESQFSHYADTLSDAYVACVGDDCTTTVDTEEDDLPTTDCQVAILGLVCPQNRGLETYAIPTLAQTRLTNRAQNIRQIVTLHRFLSIANSGQDTSAIIGSLAEQLSQTSRRFGRVLGVADATAALAEYVPLTSSS